MSNFLFSNITKAPENLNLKKNNNNKINIIDQSSNNNIKNMQINTRKNSSQVENKTAEFLNVNSINQNNQNNQEKKDLNNTSIISEFEQNKTVTTVR